MNTKYYNPRVGLVWAIMAEVISLVLVPAMIGQILGWLFRVSGGNVGLNTICIVFVVAVGVIGGVAAHLLRRAFINHSWEI